MEAIAAAVFLWGAWFGGMVGYFIGAITEIKRRR